MPKVSIMEEEDEGPVGGEGRGGTRGALEPAEFIRKCHSLRGARLFFFVLFLYSRLVIIIIVIYV